MLPKISPMTRDEWLRERQSMIGATDTVALFWDKIAAKGLKPYRTPLMAYNEKKGLARERDDSMRMKIGRMLEDDVVTMFQEDSGLTTVRATDKEDQLCILRHPERPHVGYSPDGFVIQDGIAHVLEAKTASEYLKDHWVGEVPYTYWVQVQHQLMVLEPHTNAKHGFIGMLLGCSDFRWAQIDIDSKFHAEMYARHEKFQWCLDNNVAPDACEYDNDSFGSTPVDERLPATIMLPEESDSWMEELRVAEEEARAAESTIKTVKAKLKQACGDNVRCVTPMGQAWQWFHRTRKATEATSYTEFRRVK